MDGNRPRLPLPSDTSVTVAADDEDYHVDRAGRERARLRTGIPIVDDLVSRVTGKALEGQQPFFNVTPARAYLAGMTALVASAPLLQVLVTASLSEPRLGALLAPAIIVNLAIFVGRLRAQQVVFAHHAVHGSFCGGLRWVNKAIAEFATVLTLSQNPLAYRDDHVKKHHKIRTFTTPDDPDASLLIQLGFGPGMSRRDLYMLLAKTLFSPRYHWIFAAARLRSSFVEATTVHRLLCLLWLAALGVVAMELGSAAFILGVVLPLGPLYHMSALLQFASEHRWLQGPVKSGDSIDYASRSHGRFALAVLPDPALRGMPRFVAWLGWGVRQAGQLLFRAAVTVGDLPAHDLHHVVGLAGRRPDSWAQSAFERQAAVDGGDWLRLSRRQALGWKEAFDWVFDGLAGPSTFMTEGEK